MAELTLKSYTIQIAELSIKKHKIQFFHQNIQLFEVIKES